MSLAGSQHIGTRERPDLSVIIVSYNTCALTLRAVRSVYDQKGPALEVIVVDNASSDGSAAQLAKEWPKVRLVALPDNIGFARACNLAAGVSKGHYLLLLNPDACLLPGGLDAIMSFARRWPDAKIWGGVALNRDGDLNPLSCARRPTVWSIMSQAAGLAAIFPDRELFNPEAMPAWCRDEERHVDVIIGHFLLIGRTVWQKLDGFDPAYFMYGEDVDLCVRAILMGARPAITPTARVVHEGGASQPQAPRNAQILAGRIRYARCHLPYIQRSPAVWAIRLGVALRLVAYATFYLSANHRQHFFRLRQVWRMRDLWWNGYPDVAVFGSRETCAQR